jgi:hypothetical protein
MRKLTTEELIKKDRQKHGDKYDYSTSIYIEAKVKIEILCKTCGKLFYQQPRHHFIGHGCRKCGTKKIGSYRKLACDDFIKKATEKHGDKYDYSRVIYVNYRTNIEIICKNTNHGSFFQKPGNNLFGSGCLKCIHKTETLCRLALEKIVGKSFPKYRPKFLNGLEYDMYNEEMKLAVEFNGIQHYKSKEFFGGDKRLKQQQERDEKKLRLSKLNNITLIIVPYTVTNFENYFEDYFYFM